MDVELTVEEIALELGLERLRTLTALKRLAVQATAPTEADGGDDRPDELAARRGGAASPRSSETDVVGPRDGA